MTEDEIRSALNTTLIGHPLELHEKVGSTNDLAREGGRQGEPEGLVVLAEEQVAGKGRRGRRWVAPPGCCILCSILLRPRFKPQHAFHVTMAASLAIATGIEGSIGEATRGADGQHRVTIKWPNDVLLNGRKVSGVLAESEWVGDEWSFAVVGFGINVNLDPAVLRDVRWQPTSLSAELGREVDRVGLLARVLGEFETLYGLLNGGEFKEIYRRWSDKLEIIGRGVAIEEMGSIMEGEVARVEEDGTLLVAVTGGMRRVRMGDLVRVLER
jgi:BirA family transcriptional regulator, biotin operon repressor / biotin---[acetyl-CoA-carboxylase] ligase